MEISVLMSVLHIDKVELNASVRDIERFSKSLFRSLGHDWQKNEKKKKKKIKKNACNWKALYLIRKRKNEFLSDI